MNKKEETATITMTEAQLERVIKTAVKTALRDLKEEDKLPGNQEDELQIAPATFSMLVVTYEIFLGLIILSAIFVVIACVNLMIQNGFNIDILLFALYFIFIVIFLFISIIEISKTKKIEVLNTVFSAIMALSSLIVAIVGTYFAYKAI